MSLIHFLLGLTIGGGLCLWQRRQLMAKFRMLGANLNLDASQTPPNLPRLLSALAHQQRRCQAVAAEVDVWKQTLWYAPIGYLRVDPDNQLLWCNLAAQRIFAIPADSLAKPRLLLELVRSYELDQLIDETRNTQKSRQAEWVFRPTLKEGETRQDDHLLRGIGLPLPDDQVGVFVESRKELMLLTQQRDRWTSDVAHELKTPLTSIRLVAETLRDRLTPPLQGWIDRLLGEVIRLSNLVQDLLDLSQIKTVSTSQITANLCNLTEIMHTAWLNLEPLANKKHLQLDYVGPDTVPLYADEQRLYRVLVNLLDNAIKYSPPRQHIRVQITVTPRSEPEPLFPPAKVHRHSEVGSHHGSNAPELPPRPPLPPQDIHLEVIDAGPGFTDKILPHVFERFYRGDASRTRLTNPDPASPETRATSGDSQLGTAAQGGTGLGLAIVQQIIEAHHGSVTASNHLETGGAWLQVVLPNQPPPYDPMRHHS